MDCFEIMLHGNIILSFTYEFIFPILLQAKLETKALKAKRPGFTDDRYKETAYYVENGKPIF